MKKTLAILCMAMALMSACKPTKTLLPSVSGKAGEVVVVIEKEAWEGHLGNEVRNLLACECPWLAQSEPLYSLVNVPHGAFGDLFKVHRNIVYFNIGSQVDTNRVKYGHDIWANTQCVVQIDAKDSETARQLVVDNGHNICAAIEQAERDRVISNCKKYEEKEVAPKVFEVFGGAAHYPSGYSIRKVTDDFIWIACDKQYSMQDILIYKYPAIDDEPFSKENIIRHRNEILKDNVPGMLDNSWMTTSDSFPITVEFVKYHGREFAETRGYWEVENDYMGGPFVSHSFYSEDGFDIIVTEAFVYAPRYDKRQYLRQVESILYSWEWQKKEEN